jgi:putative DNA primase/helicase
MVQGCLDWQRDGLAQPQVVLDSTEEYFEEEDAVSQWLDEDCEEDSREETMLMDLFPRWKMWAQQHGEKPGTSRDLSARLSKMFERSRMGKGGKVSFKDLKVKKVEARKDSWEDPYSKFADRVSIRSR